jgi:CHAD domain-containing protein
VAAQVKVELERDGRADRATAVVLRALLGVIEANLDGAVADLDSEYLHDLRVGVRRSRTVQRQLRRVFEPASLHNFRKEFRWLQRVTGQTRDLDVQLEDFAGLAAVVPPDLRPDLDELLRALRDRRDRAHREMVRELRSDRVTELLSGWPKYVDALEASPARHRPHAARPIARVAGRRIRRVYHETVRMGNELGPGSPAEHYHELRKRGKELRYLLELFGKPLFPGEVVEPTTRALKGVQDVLGRHQDREVQVAALHELADPSRAHGAPAANPALIQLLVARLEGDKLAARAAFARRFAPLADRQQRETVKQVFR